MKWVFDFPKYRELMKIQYAQDENEHSDAFYKWLWEKDDGREVVFDANSIYGRFSEDYDKWRIHVHQEWCREVES